MVKTEKLLIIFYRNPEKGKVKTRLAATVGNLKALQVFQQLALHTRDITLHLPMDKVVFYSDFIDRADIWPHSAYYKALQQGADLGERMKNAFLWGFESGYSSICIIGTDCYDLTDRIISGAFDMLNATDAVIGPALDGGYYLLGMKKLWDEFFENKHWSTERVLQETIDDMNELSLQYKMLQTLRDVDTEDDLPDEWKRDLER